MYICTFIGVFRTMKKELVHTDMTEGLEKHLLPQDFVTQMASLLGTAQWERMRQGLEEEAPVSITLVR